MTSIEIRKTADGRILARRTDRKPLTHADREEAKLRAQLGRIQSRSWLAKEVRTESGELRAFMVCSEPLEDHLWVIVDQTFKPADGLARYYPEEFLALRTITHSKRR